MADSEGTAVLIVEDEQELADTYAEWLRESYPVVRTAYTGEQALEAIDGDGDGDVMLLDRRLPDLPGNEVLETARGRGFDGRVAMITAVDPDFDILEMAFDDYVVKPVLKSELYGIVDRLLRLSSYDDRFQESFALASKLRALEEEKTRVELARNDEYNETRARLEELRDGLDDLFEEFEDEDYEALYRDLDRPDG